jgi:hypothetical protein
MARPAFAAHELSSDVVQDGQPACLDFLCDVVDWHPIVVACNACNPERFLGLHTQIMPRLEGWESRFAAALDQARTRPFDAREWNCALFARACVQAITGREIPARLSRNLESTVDTHFPRIERALARPGDVVLAEIPHKTLGVCTGRYATFLGVSGLYSIPMSEVLICWKV